MISFGILLIAGCILFFSPALLLGLLQNTQQKTIGGKSAGAFTFIFLFSLILLYLTWNFQITWKMLSEMKKDCYTLSINDSTLAKFGVGRW